MWKHLVLDFNKRELDYSIFFGGDVGVCDQVQLCSVIKPTLNVE